MDKASSGQGRSSEVAHALIRRTKQASRRRFPAEEKIRILLEGIRAEISVAELCRREGIHPPVYYTWLKDFMEAGKARVRGGSLPDATTGEVGGPPPEDDRLKHPAAAPTLTT